MSYGLIRGKIRGHPNEAAYIHDKLKRFIAKIVKTYYLA